VDVLRRGLVLSLKSEEDEEGAGHERGEGSEEEREVGGERED
jgi:hypothetical protein